ncbi:hypothetical protein M885DRAFT_572487 [Pelagophyceae sp. CCMP2097]|nr:hypothetical protein M885DRAFT_572487 [Pelagophyceae sp. CCMP2097]
MWIEKAHGAMNGAVITSASSEDIVSKLSSRSAKRSAKARSVTDLADLLALIGPDIGPDLVADLCVTGMEDSPSDDDDDDDDGGGPNPRLMTIEESSVRRDTRMTTSDDGDDVGEFRCGGGVALSELVGKKIVRTSMVVFRDGAPQVDYHGLPESGDVFGAVWFLEGGGYFYAVNERRGPAFVIGIWHDDTGGEWRAFTYRTPAELHAADAALRCRCGNFKSVGVADGLCNGCRDVAHADGSDGGGGGGARKRARTTAAASGDVIELA